VVFGTTVPVLLNINLAYSTFVTTILSVTVVILISLEGVYHYREQWKNYRSTEQFLSHEKYRYLGKIGAYENLEETAAFRLLLDRIEGAIEAENAATLNVLTTEREERSSGVSGK
jgi:hypothetical protein